MVYFCYVIVELTFRDGSLNIFVYRFPGLILGLFLITYNVGLFFQKFVTMWNNKA